MIGDVIIDSKEVEDDSIVLWIKPKQKVPKENIEESFWCEQRIEALKKILVCLYGTTGSIWKQTEEMVGRIERRKKKRCGS